MQSRPRVRIQGLDSGSLQVKELTVGKEIVNVLDYQCTLGETLMLYVEGFDENMSLRASCIEDSGTGDTPNCRLLDLRNRVTVFNERPAGWDGTLTLVFANSQ
jgi:hypothetical protein